MGACAGRVRVLRFIQSEELPSSYCIPSDQTGGMRTVRSPHVAACTGLPLFSPRYQRQGQHRGSVLNSGELEGLPADRQEWVGLGMAAACQ
jgi:hypothetical protein